MRLRKADVEAVFEAAADQADYLIGLYKLVLPRWDDIEKLSGHPTCNDTTWKAIARMAMDWDTAHVASLAGGAWMNSGFSGGGDVADWVVDISTCEAAYKELAIGTA